MIKQVFTALMEKPGLSHAVGRPALRADRRAPRWTARWPRRALRDITAELAPAMVAESARWGDVRTGRPSRRTTGPRPRDRVLAQMDGNRAKLRALAHGRRLLCRTGLARLRPHGPDLWRAVRTGHGRMQATSSTRWTAAIARTGGDTSPAALRYVDPCRWTMPCGSTPVATGLRGVRCRPPSSTARINAVMCGSPS
ncbi:MAG: hypothetical protein R2838_10360 [Caldilineaceae bacterium]